MSNPLISLTETELRDLSRHHIDTFENWSRRLIDEIFKNHYGNDILTLCLRLISRLSEAQPRRESSSG